VVRKICALLEEQAPPAARARPFEELITFVTDRPGHDRRYAIDAGKIERELGWKPLRAFAAGLRDTIEWYRSHRGWWEAVKSGAYLDYYERMYGERLREAGGERDRT